MSEIARSRIDADLKRKAEAVLEDIGIRPRAALEMFYAQIVKVGGLPFRPSAFPVLEEYGVTLEQVRAAEARAIKELDADRKAGNMKTFTGKLPR
jgi:addiction module RelB/DinJ family antitoxin